MSQGPLRAPVHTLSNNSQRLLHVENGCSNSNANRKTSNSNDMLQSEQVKTTLNKGKNELTEKLQEDLIHQKISVHVANVANDANMVSIRENPNFYGSRKNRIDRYIIDSKYKIYAKSVDELLPSTQKCSNYRKGVALLVSSNIDRYVVHEIDVDSDRIIGIKMHLPNDGYENGPCSTIDHIIVPDNMPFKPENVNILDDHGLNLSDHFPIVCTFNLGDSLTRLNLSNSSTNIAWNKALSNVVDQGILLKLNNKLVNDPESVCAEFANLFETIAKTSDHTEDKVNIKLLNLIRNRCDNDPIRPVHFEELLKLVINLPNGKACWLDGISYEHLKYGGKLLLRHLCNLFNLIFDQCITPVDWKTSVVIPLFKGGKKFKSDIESYRGISLIPCISNERLINFPNNQQMEYQKYLSSIYASFNLQETVHHYKERNSSIQVTFLDSKRAFDTVDHI
ncbi:unnamed protein product [Mytilus coruscus]|uniref:Reverse transcriptase domain-containing protein n=1 Tax=Mytilus coruscus TaxID=42192 RepID=A0A6J8B835_MYTCO|nr:unnamed protein product [Mytilus coruscus]